MIVDAEKGLAVISRAVIPFDVGVLSLTFAESVVIPGKVVSDFYLVDIGGIFASYVGSCVHFLGSKVIGRHSS